MTLLQNTMTGAHHLGKVGYPQAMLRIGASKEEKEVLAEVYFSL